MRNILLILLIIGIAMLLLVACEETTVVNESIKESKASAPSSSTNENKTEDTSEYTLVKFSDMYETKATEKNVSMLFQSLDGKKVHIKGYPAVQSPLDESFVYLNNQQYVTCPFCTVGDTTKLEVIPIFMANGSKIKYTENAIDVYGKLEIAEKVDSEGYTTQFRIYADKVTIGKASNQDKAVMDYYKRLTEEGMIADIQKLQMDIEYISNPDYMSYYDMDYSNGNTDTINKVIIVSNIIDEYIAKDMDYANIGGNSEFDYLEYIKECPLIVKQLEPKEERLISLNNELIKLYQDEIKQLEKYKNIVYKYNEYKKSGKLTNDIAEKAYNELVSLNADNLKQFNAFTTWNNKLREG